MTIKSNMTQKTLQSLEKLAGGPLTLGRCILAIRQSRELSQANFAKLLEISRQHLCDLEHDRKMVRPKLAAQYAKKLGESESQFIQLALQDMLEREGLQVDIKITLRKGRHRKLNVSKLVTDN